MNEPPHAAPGADLVVERLLRIIDEGRRAATYKLALLAGLIDAVLTSGAPTVPTRLIAEQVLALSPADSVCVAYLLHGSRVDPVPGIRTSPPRGFVVQGFQDSGHRP